MEWLDSLIEWFKLVGSLWALNSDAFIFATIATGICGVLYLLFSYTVSILIAAWVYDNNSPFRTNAAAWVFVIVGIVLFYQVLWIASDLWWFTFGGMDDWLAGAKAILKP